MADQNITEIKDTDYITVKRGPDGNVGVFVGGKPDQEFDGKFKQKYRDIDIYDIKYIKTVFDWMQKQHPNIAELQIMSSTTTYDEYRKTGKLSSTEGPNVYCRIVLKNGNIAPWVWVDKCADAWYAANLGAYYCVNGIRSSIAFQRVVLDSVVKQQNVIGPEEVVVAKRGPKQM